MIKKSNIYAISICIDKNKHTRSSSLTGGNKLGRKLGRGPTGKFVFYERKNKKIKHRIQNFLINMKYKHLFGLQMVHKKMNLLFVVVYQLVDMQ